MSIIEYHQGCHVNPLGCMGPWGNFYTIFGTELQFLTPHIIFAIIIGVILFGILFFLERRGKIKLSLVLMSIISIITMILLFLLFAYLAPVQVLY